MNRSRVSLLALMAIAPLSANAFVSPHSAKGNTAFTDYTGADPMANKYSLNIDGGVDTSNSGGGLAKDGISGEGIVQQQAQASDIQQLGASAARKPEAGTEDAAT